MVDAGIGRLLIASLHQGIADVSPMRLEFYENWLSPTGLRDGRMGLAPLGAVLSFVHREEPPDNERIPDRAGVCAAKWAFAGASTVRTRLIKRLPITMRSRSALRLCRSFVRETISRSKVRTRLKGSSASVDIQSPIFEYLREPSSTPMRRYYAAAVAEFLDLCDIDADVGVDTAAAGCRLTISVNGIRAERRGLLT
jgi:hypothetical protein